MDIYEKLKRKFGAYHFRKKVNLTDVSIISMNCIGGIVYHDCKQRFLSPTVNLFFTPKDFIKFVNNLKYYLSLTPVVTMGEKYPIGQLEGIKIYFMHYSSCEEALNKWEERKLRVNYDKIFVIMVERDGFSKKDFEDFKRIRYSKLLYTRDESYIDDDVLYMPKYKNQSQLPDIIPGRVCYEKNVLVNKLKRFN